MPEKQIQKRFYQVNCNGRLYFQHFQTKEKAKNFAREWLSHQKNILSVLCEIYLIEEYLTVVEEM